MLAKLTSIEYLQFTCIAATWMGSWDHVGGMLCSGSLGARLSTDAASVRAMVGDNLALVVQNLSTIVCGLSIAFSANWELSLLILAMVPLLGMQGFMQVKFSKGFSNDAKVPTSSSSSSSFSKFTNMYVYMWETEEINELIHWSSSNNHIYHDLQFVTLFWN